MSTDPDGRELLDAAQARLLEKRARNGAEKGAGRRPERAVPHLQAAPPPTHGPTPEGCDDLEDALSTLLPAKAEVTVGFLDDVRRTMFHREVWTIRFRIVDGEHAGRALSWWLRALQPGARVARASAIAIAYVAATGLRPPRDLARRRPAYFLEGAHFRVSTRVVNKNARGQERPAEASYSVVDAILGRVAGCPPALRERGR